MPGQRFILINHQNFEKNIPKMGTHRKEPLLKKLELQAETILEKAIADWQLIPHSKFCLRPMEESWSANECLQHLNSYGRYYLPAMKNAMNGKERSDLEEFSSGWLGNYFTKLMTPTLNGEISKMKSPKNHSPKSIPESYSVIAEFIGQQERLLELLHQSSQLDWSEIRVPISITPFIKLKLGDVFMFYVAHIMRHALQAERALKNADRQDLSLS